MPRIVKLEPAKDGIHKWIAHFDTGKKTKFGAKGYQDFTQHGDEVRAERYRARHRKDLDTKDPTRAGYLSYYVLWNKPTLEASVADFNRRFG